MSSKKKFVPVPFPISVIDEFFLSIAGDQMQDLSRHPKAGEADLLVAQEIAESIHWGLRFKIEFMKNSGKVKRKTARECKRRLIRLVTFASW